MGLPANSKTLTIPHFLDGLNTIQDSTQIKDTEVQLLDDMEVRPLNYSSSSDDSSGVSKLALSARGSYKTLHDDLLPFTPRNLIEFTAVSLGTTFYSQVNDYGSPYQHGTYVYTTTVASPLILGYPAISLSPAPTAGSISVVVVAMLRQHTALGGNAKLALRVGGVVYYNSAVTPTTSFASYTWSTANNPATGLPWLKADVEGSGANPLQGMGVKLDTAGGLDISAIFFNVLYISGVTHVTKTSNPSSDITTATWTVFTVAGNEYLLTGGFDTTANAFKVNYLLDGTSTTVLLKSQTAGGKYAVYDTGRCNFFKYNQYVYYNDGNFPWRKWDGVTEAASGYVTVTTTGCIHKDRAWYGGDVTNVLSNYVYYSSVGLPETVNALNFFRIGDQSDAIVSLVDMQDHLLIIKQKSVWALYVSADLTNSILIRKNKSKGSPAPLGYVWTEKGVIVYTSGAGIQRISNTDMLPTFIPVINLLRGTVFDTTASFGYIQDQVWFSNSGLQPLDADTRIFIYDVLADKVYKNNLDISCFIIDSTSSTFNGWPKACLTSGYIIELDHVNDASEATVVCYMRTKDFTFDLLPYKKKISCIILDWNAPDTSSNLTVRTWCDNAVKETFTENATQEGYNRTSIDCRPDLSRGHKISIDVSFPQKYADPLVTERFAILSMTIIYTVENRID